MNFMLGICAIYAYCKYRIVKGRIDTIDKNDLR